jgi:hypothetical protein
MISELRWLANQGAFDVASWQILLQKSVEGLREQ